MERYFLVSPHDEEKTPKRYFYWMTENGGNWVQFVKGLWRPMHADDVIKLCATAEDPAMLDWRGTWLFRPESNAGWLNRGGRFYGCPSNFHDQLARYMLGIGTSSAEDTGWVRVRDSRYYECLKTPSAEQKNWLSENGYRIYD
jgi:hypothetical protein